MHESAQSVAVLGEVAQRPGGGRQKGRIDQMSQIGIILAH
jgi:hypothetical protein